MYLYRSCDVVAFFFVLIIQPFALATPVHRRHEKAHHKGDPRRDVDATHTLPSELFNVHGTGFTIRNGVEVSGSDLEKRTQNESQGSRWGSWRPPSFQGSRPGSDAADTSSQLGQLLGEADSSFHALLSFIVENYLDIPASRPTSCSPALPSLPGQQAGSSSSNQPSPSSSHLFTTSVVSMLPHSTSVTANSSPSPSATPAYQFNPLRRDLNVAYYAQSPATQQVSFPQLCSDPSIDIIILAFVSHFFTSPLGQSSQYPTLNLASKCWAPNPAQVAADATTLIDCVSPGFAAEVADCQRRGKKVMLSLGGAQGYSNTLIPSAEKAVGLAQVLWDLFLGGTQNPVTRDIRPFGPDVVLDGIDIDNENPNGATHLPTLVSAFRTLFRDAGQKNYYLSAAPQCPRPDANIPISSMLANLDFVMPQFYNNPSCNLNSGQSFLDSLGAWSTDIAQLSEEQFGNIGNEVNRPRLLIGAPANGASGSGYVGVSEWRNILEQVEARGLVNLGGAMYWDGSFVQLAKQGNGGVGFAEVVREVLG